MQDDAESVWMTYREIAEALGISQAAAEARVRRAKWRRVVGNQAGVAEARIEVPPAELESLHGRTRRATQPDTPALERPAQGAAEGFTPFFRRLAAELDQAQAALDERTRELAETLEALAEQKGTVAGLREAVRLAEAAVADAAQRVSDARREADEAEERARGATVRAGLAEQHLARLRARSLWARLRNRD